MTVAIYTIMIVIGSVMGTGNPRARLKRFGPRKSIKELIGEVNKVEKDLLEVSQHNTDIVGSDKAPPKVFGIRNLAAARRNRVRVKKLVQKKKQAECKVEYEEVCEEVAAEA